MAKLTWKETLIPFELHKNPSYNGDAFWAIQEGKWSYFDGKTIEQVAGPEVDRNGNLIADSNLGIVTPEFKVCQLDPAGVTILPIEITNEEIWEVEFSGGTLAYRSTSTYDVHVGRLTAQNWVEEMVFDSRTWAVQGDNLVCVVPAEGSEVGYQIIAWERSEEGWKAIAVEGEFQNYLPSAEGSGLALAGDILFVGVEDALPTQESSSIFMLRKESGVWKQIQYLGVPRVKKPGSFGRNLQVSDTLLLAKGANKKLYIFDFDRDSAKHIKTITANNSANAAVGGDCIFIPEYSDVRIFELNRGVTKKKSKALEVVLSKTLRSIEGELPELLALIDQTPSEEVWTQIVEKMREAWRDDATTFQNKWLAEIEKGLEAWPDSLRNSLRYISKFDFPNVAGWFQLVRTANLGDGFATEVRDAKQMALIGKSIWPAHLRHLDLHGSWLSAKIITSLFSGSFGEKLESLNLGNNKFSAASMRALAKAKLPELKTLGLSGYTYLSAEGLQGLANNPSFTKLESINLSFSWGDDHRKSDMGAGLASLTSTDIFRLQHLNLYMSEIGDDHLYELLKGPLASEFRSLNLEYCDLSAKSAPLFTKEHLPNLTHLSLDGNPNLLETIDPEFLKGITLN